MAEISLPNSLVEKYATFQILPGGTTIWSSNIAGSRKFANTGNQSYFDIIVDTYIMFNIYLEHTN